ncbi:MBL fold metallo-hydrolase [Haloferax chudinovii]|uniref:MBL fold metallo-hydrolase n=1 Tax=Haloferax chudinovii TaxID=1109010 RepID=A0ABD5XI83_9EURY
MTPEELAARLARGDPTAVLDVRDRDEFEAWHVDGATVTATQIPAIRFTQAEIRGTVDELAAAFRDAPSPVVVVCAEGRSSAHVADLLSEAGVPAENLESGMDGWARVYRVRELPVGNADADATVLQYDRPSSGCLAYLVVAGDEAVVVDPLRAFADRYVEDARERGAELVAAVDTHVHADHVSGVSALRDRADATAVLPAGAADRGLDFEARLVADGETVGVGDAELVAIHAPGHTTEMTAFRLGDLLFAGDSLFLESVARPDLEDGDEGAPDAARRLHATLTERYGAFADDTLVAPAHRGPRTVPDEDGAYVAELGGLRERLGALSMDEAAFVSFVCSDMPPRPANYEGIIETNLGRDSLTDEEAFDVELGPNNCAATSET